MTIRGFSARTDIFIDGVRDFGGYSRDPFNIEQVEVAKGPVVVRSPAAARPAASINLVSKAPTLQSGHRRGAVGGGNADYKRAHASTSTSR